MRKVAGSSLSWGGDVGRMGEDRLEKRAWNQMRLVDEDKEDRSSGGSTEKIDLRKTANG